MATINMTNNKPSAPKSIGRQLNFAAGASSSVVGKLLEPHGLTLAQWAVLQCLWRNGDLGIKNISKLTGNAAPAASRIVDRMVNNGLLLRHEAKGDRRGVRIELSEKAESLRHLQTIYQEVNDVLLSDLSDAEAESLFALLTRVEGSGRAWLDQHSQ